MAQDLGFALWVPCLLVASEVQALGFRVGSWPQGIQGIQTPAIADTAAAAAGDKRKP